MLLPYRICGEVATPTISLRLEGVICMHGQEGPNVQVLVFYSKIHPT